MKIDPGAAGTQGGGRALPDEDDVRRGLVRFLRTAREEVGLSQAEAARRAGVSRSLLSQIEAGQLLPSVLVYVRLLHVYDRTGFDPSTPFSPSSGMATSVALSRAIRSNGLIDWWRRGVSFVEWCRGLHAAFEAIEELRRLRREAGVHPLDALVEHLAKREPAPPAAPEETPSPL